MQLNKTKKLPRAKTGPALYGVGVLRWDVYCFDTCTSLSDNSNSRIGGRNSPRGNVSGLFVSRASSESMPMLTLEASQRTVWRNIRSCLANTMYHLAIRVQVCRIFLETNGSANFQRGGFPNKNRIPRARSGKDPQPKSLCSLWHVVCPFRRYLFSPQGSRARRHGPRWEQASR